MKGREVIKIDRSMDLNQLYEFMEKYWDTDRFGRFEKGRPSPFSIEEYIMLPATDNCMVIVYPRKGKIILSVCDNIEGVKKIVFSAIPTDDVMFRIVQNATLISRVKELKGAAHEIMMRYAEHMRTLLANEGIL